MITKYKNLETWEKSMRKDIKKEKWHDWFEIGGHWYVCEEYDDSGKYMRYTSLTAFEHVDIETSNRYSSTWLSDMKATAYPIEDLRFDVSFYLDQKDLKNKNKILVLIDKLYDAKMYHALKDIASLLAYVQTV